MKRTKKWWAELSQEDRTWLVHYERNKHKGGRSDMLPDDCAECGVCGYPCLGWGPCRGCNDRYDRILDASTPPTGGTDRDQAGRGRTDD